MVLVAALLAAIFPGAAPSFRRRWGGWGQRGLLVACLSWCSLTASPADSGVLLPGSSGGALTGLGDSVAGVLCAGVLS